MSNSNDSVAVEGFGCAAMILAFFVGLTLLVWAQAGFPGLCR